MKDIKLIFEDAQSKIILFATYTFVLIVCVVIFYTTSDVSDSLITRILVSVMPFVIFSTTLWGSLFYLTRANK